MRLRQLKLIRIENDLTQQQVADALGVSRAAYCCYEKGRRGVDVETLLKLCSFYDLTIDKFVEKCEAEYIYDDEFLERQPEARYLIQLTKEERELIINLRISSKEVKDDILQYAHQKSGRKSF